MHARPILTAAEMLAAEEEAMAAGPTVGELMERAGRAVADTAWRMAGRSDALVLCGPGNNGGDGYVVARLLAERGCTVTVAALADPNTDAAIEARALWDGSVDHLMNAKPAPLLVDALFGTGLKRPLQDALANKVGELVHRAAHSVAVDVPSGVESDSGELLSPVHNFSATVALGALKPAHRLQPAAGTMGTVVVADIGIDVSSELTELAPTPLSSPAPESHKYSRGYVFVAEGTMAGAASLSAHAALRAGAGYVVMAGPERGAGPQAMIVKQASEPKTLSKLLTDDRISVAIVGPGLGLDKKAKARLQAVLGAGKKTVLDADALTLLADDGPEQISALDHMPILTPHEGEFGRLFADVEGNKVERAREAARLSNAVIIYKGSDTVVAAPNGSAAIAPPAPAWLASAGTGDVLTGIVAARYCTQADPFEAACDAVWLHGEAAGRAGPMLIADDLIGALPDVVAQWALPE